MKTIKTCITLEYLQVKEGMSHLYTKKLGLAFKLYLGSNCTINVMNKL